MSIRIAALIVWFVCLSLTYCNLIEVPEKLSETDQSKYSEIS